MKRVREARVKKVREAEWRGRRCCLKEGGEVVTHESGATHSVALSGGFQWGRKTLVHVYVRRRLSGLTWAGWASTFFEASIIVHPPLLMDLRR